MKALFVSDIHLNRKSPEISKQFFDFLVNEAKHYPQLYILGDLFEYWIGDDAVDIMGYSDCIEALKLIVTQGTETFFIHGNRDFLIGKTFSSQTGVRLLKEPYLITSGSKKIVLLHGDALCTDDQEHQKFRQQVMLNSDWKKNVLSRPPEERLEIANQLREMSQHHKSELTDEIMDVNENAVQAIYCARDVNVIIHGHTHKPAIHSYRLNSGPAQRIVLGAWYEKPSFLSLDDNEINLVF